MRQVDDRSRDTGQHARALHHLTRTRWAEVTLDANAATTTVESTREVVSPDSVLRFDALTAHAAEELASGTMYVLEANRLAGSFVITHANNAQTDRTFRWIASGD